MTANPAANPNPASTGLAPGDKLDKYEVVEQVASGGTSIVWKGYDRLLDRNVALKQYLPSSGDPDSLRDAFRREIAVQKRVATSHRNLVRVIDFIDDQRGMFLVMEYIDGHSLEQILTGHPEPMEERQALGIVGAVALALEAIHAAGVVHRDLKPSNILLPHQGGLKVGDFGLAAVIAEQDTLSTGSVRYMAPELFNEDAGENVPPDGRADIYALGMVAYEMLAGRAKFEDAFKIVLRDKRNQSLRWMKWHTNTRAKAPALRDLNPAVSQTLSDLVARMMEKDRELRVASAADLLSAIRRHFAHGTQDEEPQPIKIDHKAMAKAAARSAAPTAPLPKRSRLPWVIGGVCLLLVVLNVVLLAFSSSAKSREQAQKREEDQKAFNAARVLFNDEKWKEAKAEFDEIEARWPNDPILGKGSLARSLLADARLKEKDLKYAEALALLDKVDETGVFASNRDLIETLRSQWRTILSFRSALEQVGKQIDANKIDEARHLLEELARYSVPPAEAKLRDEKAVQLELKIKQGEIDRVMEQAKRYLPADLDGAIDKLRAAEAKYRSPRITDEIEKLTRQRELKLGQQQLRAAEKTGDKRTIADAYQAWLKIVPDDKAVDGKLKATLAEIDVEDGKRMLNNGDKVGAARKFRHALGYVSDHSEATKQLSAMKNADERQSLMEAAEQAYNSEDYEAAASYYEQLLKAGDDAALREKMQKSKARVLLKKARDLIAQNSVKEAQDVLKEALEKDPTLTEAKRQSEAIDRRAKYLEHIELGNKARSAGDLGAAKREYAKAKEILNSKQVQQLLDDTEYESLVAQSRVQFNARKFDPALALAMTAQRMRDSDEVKSLIEEIKKRKALAEEN